VTEPDSSELQLRTYRHAWGAVGHRARFASLSEFVPAVKDRAYDGIELAPVAFEVAPHAYGTDGPERLRELLAEHDLTLVPMVMTYGSTPREHVDQFERQLAEAMSWGPPFVVSHTGSDAFDDATAAELLARCVAASSGLGVRVAHETHRGRVLCTPWRTARLLEAVPDLWLKADFSHFVCVAERLLQDEGDVMAAVCARVLHTDLRIGFENGPQVPDPRDPRWESHRAAFEAWWDLIWASATSRGEPWTSVTPEYGPFSYAPPDLTADELWSACEWTTDRARERFRSGAWRRPPGDAQ
jgi:hypothetical protein